MKATVTVSPTTPLPDDVYVGQVRSLFADRKSVIMGLVNTTLCGCVTIMATDSRWTALFVAGLLSVGLLRLHGFRRFQRVALSITAIDARYWERGYTLGVSAYLIMLGMWTFSVFAASSDPLPLIIALTATISTAYGIPIRNFAFEHGTRIQTAAVAAPLVATFAHLGGAYYSFIVLVLLPTFLFIRSSATRLRVLLLSELLYRHKSEQIAGQLDMAVNNMPVGLCMFSDKQTMLISNKNLHSMLGLGDGRRLANKHVDIILRFVAAKKMFPNSEFDRLREFVRSALSGIDVPGLQVNSRHERAYDVTISRSPNGNSILIVQDITDRVVAERAIDRLARFDSITGLPNRHSFEISLKRSLQGCASSVVLFVDLDDFKQVNDTLGHSRGDRYLRAVGERLRAYETGERIIARWGGDEFVILLHNQDTSHAFELADSLIRDLSQPCEIDGHEIAGGASIGIARATSRGEPAELLLQHADMALYAAKSAGRRQWRAYKEEMHAAAQMRSAIEREVRNALTAGAFELHFQPIVDIATGKLQSFEALARWRHPERGMVPPTEFIPIVEKLGLMNDFGAWALETACRECATWPQDIRVSVNLSAIQILTDRMLEERIQAALARSNLSAARLELEITESTLLEAGPSALRRLQAIRNLGARVALDDFGTGFSSLSYLLSFPLDKVKVDRSFTNSLATDSRATILVESVARLCTQLGMSVTAEGIETTDQLEFLRALGTIKEGQGYLFSKPVPAEQIPGLAARLGAARVSERLRA